MYIFISVGFSKLYVVNTEQWKSQTQNFVKIHAVGAEVFHKNHITRH